MDYDVTEVPEKTYAVIRRTVPFPEVPTAMQELMGQVHGWAENVPPGVEVEKGAVDPPEPFELVTRPAQRSAVHVGSYEGLPGVFQELYDTLKRDGLEEGGEPIEIYEKHDPVPETRIIWPLA